MGEICGFDAVDFLCGPLDGLIRVEIGDEGVVVAGEGRPGGEADLDGLVGHAGGGASGFEVDGGEEAFVDELHLVGGDEW